VDDFDVHNYSSDISSYTQQVHGWMNQTGHGSYPLWLSEWATYRGGYENVSTALGTVLDNLVRGSRSGNDHIDGSHLFTFYDWGGFSGGFQNFEGLVGPSGAKLKSFYALRMGTRALKGCRPTYQATTSTSNLLAIATTDATGAVYLLVINDGRSSQTVDANLSALKTTGTGTQWQLDATHDDTVVANPSLSNGHVTLSMPKMAAVLLKF